MHAELAAAAAEVDEARALAHRGRDRLDREPHALRADREAHVAHVRRFDPLVRVPVEVLPDVILHRPTLASPVDGRTS